ncbi:cation:dicarboxylate symporter family transporter [Ramlibacter sp.]|uniref:cation:dicarboxylate symporter family transporter n=1 Tax=Ramlibacter sp. TaxID=1917967 RepID=UPI003D0E58D6
MNSSEIRRKKRKDALLALVRHPAMLVVSLVLGALTGGLFPRAAPQLAAASTAYLALLNMAAVPLIVVGVFLGLRRIVSLPQAGMRLVALVGGGAIAMAACALLAAGLAKTVGSGAHMPEQQVAILGAMALKEVPYTVVSLRETEEVVAPPAKPWRVPNNFFFALVSGSLPAILLCAVFFAVAFAAQPQKQAAWLQGQFEPIYRTLELLIDRLSDFLPVVAFALAATVASTASAEGLLLMQSFLLPFFVTVSLIAAVSTVGMATYLGRSSWDVLRALERPLVVALFSSGPAAAIPSFIDSMCNRLGFRRDLVEFTAPLAPAFLRAGEAAFFAVLAVFVANVYGKELGTLDLVLIAGVSMGAAFVSVNVTGVRSITAGGIVLGYLGLPMEALLPAFILLEVICEGLRNVVSMLLSGALIALVSRGLPKEKPATAAGPALALAAASQFRFELTRGRAAAAAVLVACALAAAYFAGLGLGLRKAQALPSAVPEVPALLQPSGARSVKP